MISGYILYIINLINGKIDLFVMFYNMLTLVIFSFKNKSIYNNYNLYLEI